jgi:hypothetical protein
LRALKAIDRLTVQRCLSDRLRLAERASESQSQPWCAALSEAASAAASQHEAIRSCWPRSLLAALLLALCCAKDGCRAKHPHGTKCRAFKLASRQLACLAKAWRRCLSGSRCDAQNPWRDLAAATLAAAPLLLRLSPPSATHWHLWLAAGGSPPRHPSRIASCDLLLTPLAPIRTRQSSSPS